MVDAPRSGDRVGDTKEPQAYAARKSSSRSTPELNAVAGGEPCQLARFSVAPLSAAIEDLTDLLA